MARLGQDLRDGCLIGLRGRGGEGEGNLPQSELEQAIAAARLAVIVALGCGSGDDLDLAVIETETPVDAEDLRLDRALVRKEEPRWTALNDRRRDRAGLDIGQRLGGEHDGGVLLAQRLEPFAQLRAEAWIVEREPALIDDE